MKILVLNYEYPPLGGGAAPVTEELCKSLYNQGHEVVVVTSETPTKFWASYDSYYNINHGNSLSIYRVETIRKNLEKANAIEMMSYLIPGYLKAKELVSDGSFDLIHCHFIFPTGYIARMLSKKFQIPYIITSHGSDVPGYNPDRFRLLHKLLHIFWLPIVDESKLIITPSERLKKLIMKNKVNENKVRVIPNGINVGLEQNYKKEKIILYAGRLFKRKGVLELIEACEDMPDGWELVIAGDGDEKYIKQLKQEIYERGLTLRTYMPGWLSKEELVKWYKKSSIFVLPSSEESFGMVVLEAMSYKNMVFVKDACKEVVGDAGKIFSNSLELKHLLRKYMCMPNELKKYQDKAYKRALDFDWNKIVKSYEKVFRNI